MDQHIPETDDLNFKPQLRYYQWMPFILLGLALFYQIPCLFWRANNEKSGLNLNSMIRAANKYIDAGNTEDKEEIIKLMTEYFNRYFDMRRRWDKSNKLDIIKEIMAIIFCGGKKYDRYLCRLYIFTKIMYFVNTVVQCVLTDMLLSSGEISFYGIQLLHKFNSGKPNADSYYFPRVTYCDLRVREVGYEIKGHRYTVQCVLPINLFSEAIFCFYWFWLVMIVCFNAYSLVKWCWYLVSTNSSVQYIRKHIRDDLFDEGDLYSILREFVENVLMKDGVFALKMISNNSTDLCVTDLVSGLYKNYKIRRVGPEQVPDEVPDEVPFEDDIL
ncbi:innexin-19-like [Octopus sinensis]|uniref:Innexin n=1 Tax=Octopus sinensis TaxID=2607531 RepID=A0A6P7U034_9MOLL|nr:innexin-19-like [Octopus sinensis]